MGLRIVRFDKFVQTQHGWRIVESLRYLRAKLWRAEVGMAMRMAVRVPPHNYFKNTTSAPMMTTMVATLKIASGPTIAALSAFIFLSKSFSWSFSSFLSPALKAFPEYWSCQPAIFGEAETALCMRSGATPGAKAEAPPTRSRVTRDRSSITAFTVTGTTWCERGARCGGESVATYKRFGLFFFLTFLASFLRPTLGEHDLGRAVDGKVLGRRSRADVVTKLATKSIVEGPLNGMLRS